jgi:hypothetical protein
VVLISHDLLFLNDFKPVTVDEVTIGFDSTEFSREPLCVFQFKNHGGAPFTVGADYPVR